MTIIKDIHAIPQLLPREKLLQEGVEALNDAELLALFLRTGTQGMSVLALSQKLIDDFGSLYHLMNASHDEFCQYNGLGTAKYTQLKAVIELSSRYLGWKIKHDNPLTTPTLTYHYLASRLSIKEREVFMVIFLNNQHHVILSEEMFSGTFNCVEVHPREVARRALQCNAAAIIIAHNHPSGLAEPSDADKSITAKLKHVCELIDIRVLDHIVIGKGEYVSFAERGWI